MFGEMRLTQAGAALGHGQGADQKHRMPRHASAEEFIE